MDMNLNVLDYEGAVVHHAAYEWSDKETALDVLNDIDIWHRERGFAMIGYHYVIFRGTLLHGRPVIYEGAHCKGHNEKIGICIAQNLSKSPISDINESRLFKFFYYDLPRIYSLSYHENPQDDYYANLAFKHSQLSNTECCKWLNLDRVLRRPGWDRISNNVVGAC